MPSKLEHYVRQAKQGDKQALEMAIESIQHKIYGLAMRMMGNDEDAEDETQEILIKIVTHLSEFREESAFGSWVYRVACNHLLTKQKHNSGHMAFSFDALEEMILAQSDECSFLAVSGPERALLAEEARLNCMQAVLACLDKKTRMAYILGDIYGVTSKEACCWQHASHQCQ